MRTTHPIARILIALIIIVLAYYYFRAVLPQAGAVLVALALGALELVTPLFSKQSGVGGSLRVLVQIAGAALVWPAIALALEHFGGVEWGAAVAVASAIACAGGIIASGHGSGQDRARIAAIIVSVCLPLYAIVVNAFDPSPLAWAAAGGGVAVAAGVATASGVWPARIEKELTVAAGLAGVAALASLLRWVL